MNPDNEKMQEEIFNGVQKVRRTWVVKLAQNKIQSVSEGVLTLKEEFTKYPVLATPEANYLLPNIMEFLLNSHDYMN